MRFISALLSGTTVSLLDQELLASHLVLVLLLVAGRPLQQSLRLRRFKSDLDET